MRVLVPELPAQPREPQAEAPPAAPGPRRQGEAPPVGTAKAPAVERPSVPNPTRDVVCQSQVTYTFMRKHALAKFLPLPEAFQGAWEV